MSERKAIIKAADCSEDMQQDAIDCASQVRRFQRPSSKRHPVSGRTRQTSRAQKGPDT